MKKYLIIPITIMLLLSGCISDNIVEFKESKYTRNETYGRSFDIMYFDSDEISIGIYKNLYDELEINNVYKQIKDDYELVSHKLDITLNKLNIYILDETIAGGAYISGDSVFCTLEDLENGNYREPMLKQILRINKTWIIKGLKGILYNEEYDVQLLSDFYKSEDDISILGLLDTRFYEEFNTDDEIILANQTSISLISYILSNYSFDGIFSENLSDIKNEWLQYIGVDRTFTYVYMNDFKDMMFLKIEGYTMLVVTKDAKYYIKPLEGQLETAIVVEEFLYRCINARQALIEVIANADHNIDMQTNEYIYYIDDTINISHAINGSIYLNRTWVHAHEAVHVILQSNPDDHWESEGIAEYLGNIVCPTDFNYLCELIFLGYQDKIKKIENGELGLADEGMDIFKYYYDRSAPVDNIYDIDMRLYYDAVANVSLFNQEKLGYAPFYEIHRIKECDRLPGDELNYFQAGSFTAYLVDKYSLETYLRFISVGKDFELIFGESYDKLKEEWMSYLIH